jgi:hypothetical protein
MADDLEKILKDKNLQRAAVGHYALNKAGDGNVGAAASVAAMKDFYDNVNLYGMKLSDDPIIKGNLEQSIRAGKPTQGIHAAMELYAKRYQGAQTKSVEDYVKMTKMKLGDNDMKKLEPYMNMSYRDVTLDYKIALSDIQKKVHKEMKDKNLTEESEEIKKFTEKLMKKEDFKKLAEANEVLQRATDYQMTILSIPYYTKALEDRAENLANAGKKEEED